MSDSAFRSRLLRNLALAMVVAVFVGGCVYLSALGSMRMRGRPVSVIREQAIPEGLNTAAISFWILFPVLFLTRVYKTAAVLDCDRRIRLAEEMYRRGY